MNLSFANYFATLLVLIALLAGAYVFIHAAVYAPEAASSTLAIVAAPSASSTPVALASDPNYPSRLIIPSLTINAHIQYTGITIHDTIGIPTNFTDVAWYEYSAVPGHPGDAVIDGHVDNGLGLAGVFKHLSQIQTGDTIEIVTNGGTTLHFVVSAITAYNYQAVPVAQLLSTEGPPTLELITCEGDWVSGQNTYNERMVVTATLQQ